MPIIRIVDSPLIWGLAGFSVGLALGVSDVSVWLVVLGLGGFLLYLRLHGPAANSTEGWLFAAAPVFMMSWLLGLVLRSTIL